MDSSENERRRTWIDKSCFLRKNWTNWSIDRFKFPRILKMGKPRLPFPFPTNPNKSPQPISIHHFHPCAGKVAHEFFAVVILCIDFGVGAQN